MKNPSDKNPEPAGGRAEQRRKEFLRQRLPADEVQEGVEEGVVCPKDQKNEVSDSQAEKEKSSRE